MYSFVSPKNFIGYYGALRPYINGLKTNNFTKIAKNAKFSPQKYMFYKTILSSPPSSFLKNGHKWRDTISEFH